MPTLLGGWDADGRTKTLRPRKLAGTKRPHTKPLGGLGPGSPPGSRRLEELVLTEVRSGAWSRPGEKGGPEACGVRRGLRLDESPTGTLGGPRRYFRGHDGSLEKEMESIL